MKRLRDALAGVACVILASGYFVVLYLANIARPRALDGVGGKVITAALGLPRHTLAITFGSFVFCKRRFPSLQTLRHEMTHVAQYQRFGWVGFLYRYGADIARRGYSGSYLEAEARARAGQ